MAGTRPGQRRVAGESLELFGRHRVGAHDALPLRPLAVADADGDRATLGEAVPDPAEQLDVVPLEGHPGAAAMAEPAARQRVGDRAGGHLDAGGQALQGGEQGRSVRLSRGQPAQHAVILARSPPRTGGLPGVRAGQLWRGDQAAMLSFLVPKTLNFSSPNWKPFTLPPMTTTLK